MSTEVVLCLMGEIATKNYGVDDCDNAHHDHTSNNKYIMIVI